MEISSNVPQNLKSDSPLLQTFPGSGRPQTTQMHPQGHSHCSHSQNFLLSTLRESLELIGAAPKEGEKQSPWGAGRDRAQGRRSASRAHPPELKLLPLKGLPHQEFCTS